MPIEYRPITEEELIATAEMSSWAFGGHFSESELPQTQEFFEMGESVAAFDGSDPVGLVLYSAFEMTVPGGSATTACVGPVVVLPTHRRRGIMTEMMKQQLTNAFERGLALSPLEAAESIIYGRFGYGIAAEHENWTIQRQDTAFRQQYEWNGSLKIVKADYAKVSFPNVFRRATPDRPGVIQPPKTWWDGMFDDLAEHRDGASANFYVEYREDNVEGYVVYRLKGDTVVVQQLMAVTDAAYAALWGYCFGIDLRTTTKAYHRPVDDALVWMLANPRQLKREPYDRTWMRLVDVPKALSSRTYATEDTLVFQVDDDFCPWNQGTYELTGGLSGAVCKPTTKVPDLVLTSADLAVPYLGGFRFAPLARAGRVEERTRGALRRADAMFATQLKPWSPVLC